jgi:flagellar motor protein MotB
VLVSTDMAKDPFAGPATRKLTAGRVALGLVLISSVTFAFGYYLPLSDAHTLLAKEHRALSEAANGTKAQLEKTTEQLLSAKSERDDLQAVMKKVETERASGKTALDTITQSVETKLASSIKAKVVVVEPAADRVTLFIDDSRVFKPNEVQPHKPGQTLLCAIAKGLKDVDVDFHIGEHSQANKVTDVTLKRNYPTPWELTAARAGAAARTMVGCGLPEKATRAVGLGHAQTNSDAGAKSTGEIRIALYPRKS